jgi:predicted TPR repeat methyltransferase
VNRAQRRTIAKSKDSKDLLRLAGFYHSNGQHDLAEQKYRQAINLDPGCAEAHNNLGVILKESGRIAEATAHFNQAFKISGSDPAIVSNLAWALSAQHRFHEGVVLYRQAISLNPLFADAYFGLAIALTDLGQHGEAELCFVKVLEIEPQHWTARIWLGMVLVDQGKIAQALEQAQILVRAETAAGFPHKAFGILLARAGCPDGARLCFQTHLSHNPADEHEIAMLLAAVGGALPQRASNQRLLQLYAGRANRWDQASESSTGYQGHRLVVSAISQLSSSRVNTIVDAGCGTGLVGELLRSTAGHLVGVDISEAMLSRAREKHVYDELHCGDLVEYLASHPRSCDIISSAATLIHFSDLNPIFAAAASCLRPAGLFVFTVFPNDDDPETVGIGTLNGLAQAGCFRHGSGYVTETAAKHGFIVERLQREAHEYFHSAPIAGLVIALRMQE